MTSSYDAVIIGGGHNGLVAAAYLARAGRRVVVLERRDVVGGAAVTEQPFGPDYRVTSLSYVVSLFPPDMVRDLDLTAHGYHVYPQGPYFAPRRDGRALHLSDDPRLRREQIAAFAPADAGAYERWNAWLGGLGALVGPLLSTIPPRVGSHRPADLVSQAGLLRTGRKVDVRTAYDLTKLFTTCLADLLEDRFSSDALRGVLSVSGVIGTWAGPRSPGTAYVALHHHIGETTWGFPRGGMGGVTQAIAGAARQFGAEIRTGAGVVRVEIGNGRVRGVTLAAGTQISAPVVITTAHPRIFLPRAGRPGAAASRLRGRHRGVAEPVGHGQGELSRSTGCPCSPPIPSPTPRCTAARSCWPSRSTTSRPRSRTRWLDGPPSCRSPTCASRACSTRPWRRRATTSSAPSPSGCRTAGSTIRTRTNWTRTPTASPPGWRRSRPGSPTRSSGRQVIGPDTMQSEYGLVGGNIFHGELTVGQMFHCRPAAGYADLRTPVRGLYQAGSATHGGGGVTGIPGRNVVRQVLRDQRGLRRR